MANNSSLPHFCAGPIIKGFGRGSKELGCPTGIFEKFALNAAQLFWFI